MQRELLAGRQRVEQPDAHAGLGYVADHADKFALGRDQLGGADQQGETRCGAQLRAGGCAVVPVMQPCGPCTPGRTRTERYGPMFPRKNTG
jgi:hypothetical protein